MSGGDVLLSRADAVELRRMIARFDAALESDDPAAQRVRHTEAVSIVGYLSGALVYAEANRDETTEWGVRFAADTADRDAYDRISELLANTPPGPEKTGVTNALAAVAALRFRARATPHGVYGVRIEDTWTGWTVGGWQRGLADAPIEDRIKAAHVEVDRLNQLCAERVMAGQDPAVPTGDEHDKVLAVLP